MKLSEKVFCSERAEHLQHEMLQIKAKRKITSLLNAVPIIIKFKRYTIVKIKIMNVSIFIKKVLLYYFQKIVNPP